MLQILVKVTRIEVLINPIIQKGTVNKYNINLEDRR